MNTFGTLFRISLFGESHGPAIGVVIDGCPPVSVLIPKILSRILQDGKAEDQYHGSS